MQDNCVFLISLDLSFLENNSGLVEQSRKLAQTYQAKEIGVADEALRKVGASLWASLDCDVDFNRYQQVIEQSALNIVIESESPKVLNLAWETLYHPRYGFLGRSVHFTLSRKIPTYPLPVLPELESKPLRILVFSAMPMDLGEHGRLKIEEEKANIIQAVTPLEDRGLVELVTPNDGRFTSFKKLLKEHLPHLVYLSGHGSLHHNTLDNTYHSKFLFEDNYANSLEIFEDELVECFNNTCVQAIVLSACESGKFDARDLNNGLSIRLSQKGIPHVIGMRESILDSAGLEFSVTFLEGIANKKPVATALQLARSAIKENIIGYVSHTEMNNSVSSKIIKSQWCLPSLISHEISHALIDWSFTPKPKDYAISFNNRLENITLPEQFLGRKREIYNLFQPLLIGTRKQLLLTAAGGIGKTALAGQLCQQLKQNYFEVFVYSAQEGNQWSDFVTDLQLALEDNYATQYDTRAIWLTETQKAQTLLEYLLAQYNGKVVLFLDGLDSLQDPHSRHLIDNDVETWLVAAKTLYSSGLRIILTSRICLPDWEGEPNYDLDKPVYSDFIAFARQKGLLSILSIPEKSRELYDVLGGNFRAIEFFVSASKNMDLAERGDFLTTLNQAKHKSQTHMALKKLLSQISDLEISLLIRMLAYPTAVPIKGVTVIALKVMPALSTKDEHVNAVLNLVNTSLIECTYNHKFGEVDYQVTPLVNDYLIQNNKKNTTETLKISSLYLKNDLLKERPRLDLALITYTALTEAGQIEDAQQLLLNTITRILNRAGLYNSLLNDYLLKSLSYGHSAQTLAETQNQIGKQYLHIGSYEMALKYLQQSLIIRRNIRDKSGEGTTLNNISQIFRARGDYVNSLKYLEQSLSIQQETGNKSEAGTTLNNISGIYQARGDYQTALKYLEQSLTIRREIGDKTGEGVTLNNISQIYDARGEYDIALVYLQQSLAIRQDIGDKSGEGTTLNNISQIFKAWGDYEAALKYLQQSLAIRQDIGDKSGEGTTLNNISQIYDARGDYETALKYLQQSLAIRQDIGDKSGEGTTLNNISQIYDARGDYETALKYLQQSLAIAQDIGDKSAEGSTLNNISQIFDARGDYETALKYLKQSLAIGQDIGDKSGVCVTTINLGHIYWQNDDQKSAMESWGKAYSIAKEIEHAQALAALESIADQLDLEGGLVGFENLGNSYQARKIKGRSNENKI